MMLRRPLGSDQTLGVTRRETIGYGGKALVRRVRDSGSLLSVIRSLGRRVIDVHIGAMAGPGWLIVAASHERSAAVHSRPRTPRDQVVDEMLSGADAVSPLTSMTATSCVIGSRRYATRCTLIGASLTEREKPDDVSAQRPRRTTLCRATR